MRVLIVTTLLLLGCSPVASPRVEPTASAAPPPSAVATPAATPTASPTATVGAGLTRYVNPELGYSVDLPAGWHRAACSRGIATTSPLQSSEIFVGVPDAEEIIRGGTPFVGVRVADAGGLTPQLWLERNAFQPDMRFEPVTVDGRTGARAFFETTGTTYALAFAERGWVYEIERTYFGVEEPVLERIVMTLRVLGDATVGRASAPTPTPTPRSIESVVDALVDGFASKDLNAISETMAPCLSVGAVPGDPDMRSRAAFVTTLPSEFAAGTSVRLQSRPIDDDPNLGRFVRSTWSRPGQADQRVDFLLRADGARWSVVAVLIRMFPN